MKPSLSPHFSSENNPKFQKFLGQFEIDRSVKETVDAIIKPKRNNSEFEDLLGYYIGIILSDGTRYNSDIVIEKLKKYNSREAIKNHFNSLLEKGHYDLFSYFYSAVQKNTSPDDIIDSIYSQLNELINTLDESVQISE